MSTGTGAHINAPFYGSLDRRQINFNDEYNGYCSSTFWTWDAAMGLTRAMPKAGVAGPWSICSPPRTGQPKAMPRR